MRSLFIDMRLGAWSLEQRPGAGKQLPSREIEFEDEDDYD
jgi:hypothetical protein